MFMAAALFVPLNMLEEFRQREKHSVRNSKQNNAKTQDLHGCRHFCRYFYVQHRVDASQKNTVPHSTVVQKSPHQDSNLLGRERTKTIF